jgi:hypothetical protein
VNFVAEQLSLLLSSSGIRSSFRVIFALSYDDSYGNSYACRLYIFLSYGYSDCHSICSKFNTHILCSHLMEIYGLVKNIKVHIAVHIADGFGAT